MWSSKVQVDHARLHEVEPDIFPVPDKFRNWTQDTQSVNHFVAGLEQIGTDLKYVHFLGGETLYMKAFWDITERMAEIGFPNTTIGTTTTGTTTWRHGRSRRSRSRKPLSRLAGLAGGLGIRVRIGLRVRLHVGSSCG